MTFQTPAQLIAKHCAACHGSNVERLNEQEAQEQLKALPGWKLSDDAKHIRKHWEMNDFAAGMVFLQQVAALAEQEDHHPDVHLEGYRHVRIELSTHTVDGLTENDLIMAAKIDQLPAPVRK